jgi:hypothetical protein
MLAKKQKNWNTQTLLEGGGNGMDNLEKFGSSSKNLKTQLPYEQAILLPGIQN